MRVWETEKGRREKKKSAASGLVESVFWDFDETFLQIYTMSSLQRQSSQSSLRLGASLKATAVIAHGSLQLRALNTTPHNHVTYKNQ